MRPAHSLTEPVPQQSLRQTIRRHDPMLSRRVFLKFGVTAGAFWASAAGTSAADSTTSEPSGSRQARDRKRLVYRGTPPDLCVCDQALRVLPDGTWAIFFMTGGDNEPRKANYIAMTRSADRGKTWGRKETVLQISDRACLLSEAYIHKDTIVMMVVTHGGIFEDWRSFTLTSRDGGTTWDPLKPFGPLLRRAFVRNLYTASWGEWYLPFQSYDTMPDPVPSPLKDGSHACARNGVLISRDEGVSWTRSAELGPVAGWAENNVVELRDGSLVMLIRADGKGYLLRSDSTDRGRTWSHPAPTNVPNPGSKFRLHRLRTGRIILLHNANAQAGIRNPLALWCSDDDLRTWARKRVLSDFPGQLQYPDGFVDETEGFIHFAFDYNRHDLIYMGAVLPP